MKGVKGSLCAAALVTLIALSACGGGSGGGGGGSDDLSGYDASSLSGVTIDSGNVDEVGEVGGSGGKSLGDLSSSDFQDLVISGVHGGGAEDSGRSASVAELTRIAITKVLERTDGSASVAGLVQEENCDSGSVAVVEEGTSNGALDAGDRFEVDFDNCVITYGGFSSFTYDGGFELEVKTLTGDISDDSADWSYKFVLTYKPWSIKGSGGFSMDLLIDGQLVQTGSWNSTSELLTVGLTTGSDKDYWVFRDNETDVVIGYADFDAQHEIDKSGSTNTFETTITSTHITGSAGVLGDGSYRITVNTESGKPLAGDVNGNPSSGVVTISGAGGARARVDAGDGACNPGTSYMLLFDDGSGFTSKGCKNWD
ncbi:hypothetical protein [Thiohalorhabdus methylotrophus]|uniref:Lipoprotein n=1 Tax=Thiohalorhabdus methylotrophus TaxID=3242694 RepID=A0ABV4TSU7_9GAMM